jgi:hypothetical protein
MPFVEMDPELAMKAIEGYTNELEPENRKLEAFYRQFKCKRCKGPVRKETLSNHCFADPSTLVARAVLRCEHCSCLFDPFSGIVLELGDPSKILGVPILGQEK